MARNNPSAVVGFSYDYDGTIGGDNYSYRVENHVFAYESMEYPEYGEMTMTVDDDFLQQLRRLYLDYRVAEWDGYSKYSPHICDGSGFSLSYSFADGKSLRANGRNCTPARYGEYIQAMCALFDPLVLKLRAAARSKCIEEGFQGKLHSIMANFIQKGKSGEDSYKFLILPEDSPREQNFDVTIKSVSGEFIEAGKHIFYGHLDNNHICFDEIQRLIERHGLVHWYRWNEAAEDYNNSEWFQISFSFDDGKTLNAMGTKHPAGYDEFRTEFLKLMIGKISAAKRDGVL